MALGPDGSIYAAGKDMEYQQTVFRQYSSADGSVVWTNWNSDPVVPDYAGSDDVIATGADGNVYMPRALRVFSEPPTPGSSPLESSFFGLSRYSPSGELLFDKQTLSSNSEVVRPLFKGTAAGNDGSIYAAGRAYIKWIGWQLLLVKYSPDGAVLWQRTWEGGAIYPESGLGVAVAPDQSVYVVGRVHVTGQAWGLLLQKYSPDGALLWTKIHDGEEGQDDSGWDDGGA